MCARNYGNAAKNDKKTSEKNGKKHAVNLFGKFARTWVRILRPFLFALLALSLTSTRPAAADGSSTPYSYAPNHVYVNYTANFVPCSQGNLVDVTNGLTDETGGHVYDAYGNLLTLSATDNYIRDSSGTIVGFIYEPAFYYR